jgi:hypothetical protein
VNASSVANVLSVLSERQQSTTSRRVLNVSTALETDMQAPEVMQPADDRKLTSRFTIGVSAKCGLRY